MSGGIIILNRSFGKLNQQFNLKHKFSVTSDPKKTQFLRFTIQYQVTEPS